MEIDLEMAIIKDSKAKPVNSNQWGHRPGRRNYIFMFDGSWDTSRSRSAASSMCGGGNRKTLFLTVFSQNLLRGEAVAVDAYKLALPAHGELGVLGFDHGLSLRSIPSCTHFFFEKFLLNDELTNLAFQAGGLRFALLDRQENKRKNLNLFLPIPELLKLPTRSPRRRSVPPAHPCGP
jgi:hypothetical protein